MTTRIIIIREEGNKNVVVENTETGQRKVLEKRGDSVDMLVYGKGITITETGDFK